MIRKPFLYCVAISDQSAIMHSLQKKFHTDTQTITDLFENNHESVCL